MTTLPYLDQSLDNIPNLTQEKMDGITLPFYGTKNSEESTGEVNILSLNDKI